MTVRELISLNPMITDAEITVRVNGSALLDQLNIGPYRGQKPPFPLKVPKSEKYIGNTSECYRKEAKYIQKSINSWDDGKDYWDVKPDRIPKAWLDLEVFTWGCRDAGISRVNRRTSGIGRNVNFHGQQIDITVLPSGQTLDLPTPKEENADLDGQISLTDWLEGVTE